jgi:DNA topoisomerase-3
VAADFGETTPAQQAAMERILKTLAAEGTPSSGRLHRELFGDDFERSQFEGLLSALHRAGYINIEEESFESEGRLIEFHRPVITPSGRRATADEIGEVRIAVPSKTPARRRRSKKASRSKRPGAKATSSSRKSRKKKQASPRKKSSAGGTSSRTQPAQPTAVVSRLSESLRRLRLAEARRRGIPAFRIFSDKVLDSIAADRPATSAALLQIKGVGPALSKNYGGKILRVVGEHRTP